jgi:hypothetical protein
MSSSFIWYILVFPMNCIIPAVYKKMPIIGNTINQWSQ